MLRALTDAFSITACTKKASFHYRKTVGLLRINFTD